MSLIGVTQRWYKPPSHIGTNAHVQRATKSVQFLGPSRSSPHPTTCPPQRYGEHSAMPQRAVNLGDPTSSIHKPGSWNPFQAPVLLVLICSHSYYETVIEPFTRNHNLDTQLPPSSLASTSYTFETSPPYILSRNYCTPQNTWESPVNDGVMKWSSTKLTPR